VLCLGISRSSWTFPFVFGPLVTRLCGGALGGASLQRWEGAAARGQRGCRVLCRARNPLPQQRGRKYSRQPDRRPPLVFSWLFFIPDSLLLFSFSFSFPSVLLPSFSFPLHSSHHEPQPAAALSQGNSSHLCVFLIALDPFNNERE